MAAHTLFLHPRAPERSSCRRTAVVAAAALLDHCVLPREGFETHNPQVTSKPEQGTVGDVLLCGQKCLILPGQGRKGEALELLMQPWHGREGLGPC